MLSNLVIEGNGSHFALSSKTKTGCTIKHFVQISLQLKYSSSLLTICTFHKQVEHALIQFFATLQQELPFLQFSRTWSSFSLDVSPLLCAQLLQWGLTLCDLMKSCRLLCLWDSPGKNTGVGCHSLLQGSSQTRDRTWFSCTAGRFFTVFATKHTIIKLLKTEEKENNLESIQRKMKPYL